MDRQRGERLCRAGFLESGGINDALYSAPLYIVSFSPHRSPSRLRRIRPGSEAVPGSPGTLAWLALKLAALSPLHQVLPLWDCVPHCWQDPGDG